MKEVNQEELDDVIRKSKNKKAAGISGIPYDFWKKAKEATKGLLLLLINESIEESSTPIAWKKGMIYPIKKKMDWNKDLKLTRPITLIETARKLMIKIITNRLSKILTENKILEKSNYAALLNNSTFEPLKIVQGIIEDANKYKKEAWILLMDISKAYDSVSSIMLEKCLNRIKLPKNFIELVMEISLNRFNKVIVGKEMTEEYYVQDGIDQGEVWSPILWRIFYDPLLTQLKTIKKEAGYTIEIDRIIDINKKTTENMRKMVNVTAFMDDTTLIAKDKNNLEKMIKICHEFFDINDIQANVKKYELIKINKPDEDLIINENKITNVNNAEGNRYLGFYFRKDNKRGIYIKVIKSIIDKACKIFNYKHLTDKQTIAVWNMVIIPRIEYQLQGIVLNKRECTKLMARINVLVKRKANLASCTNNFIIYDKEILGLKNIYDLQIENLSKNLLYQANGNKDLKKIFKIKLYQTQQEKWIAGCIGDNIHTIKRNSNNYIIDALKLLKDEGIHICDHEIKNENTHHGKIGGNIEIREILSDKEYAGAKESCRKRELLFLEQLLEEDNRRLLKWKHLCMEQGRNIKGKIPKWFKILEKKVTIEGSRMIKEKYLNKNLFRTSINMLLFDEDERRKKSDEIITWNMEEELIFCIDKKKSRSKEHKRIGIHMIMKDFDLENSPTLEKCKGCEKNVARKNKNKEECMININT